MASQLRVDKIVPVDGAPTGGGGGIVQVKSTTLTTNVNVTIASGANTTFYDVSGLSVAITPKFSTSKILIRYNINVSINTDSNIAFFQIVRGSTAVGNGTQGSSRTKCHTALRGQHSDTNPHGVTSGEFLDSPSTTSATTYKIQYTVDGNTCFINKATGDSDVAAHPSPLSTLTLMEVSA